MDIIELSIIIPALNEASNIALLIKKIKDLLYNHKIGYEIIVVDGGSRDGTVEIARKMDVKVIIQKASGLGNALLEGFRVSRGKMILTLDADFSHPPDFIIKMLMKINEAEVIVGSRYIKGGIAEMPFFRYILSRILNLFFQYGLSLLIKDVTSGFRIYKREVIDSINIYAEDFDVLPEILIEVYSKGWRIKEIPLHYVPRASGNSHVRMFNFAIDYLRLFLRLWRKRNSIMFADYEQRAYNSRIFLQRYWQRKRYSIIMNFIEKNGLLADLGCGSSKIIQDLPKAVAVDLSIEKLRYIRKHNRYLVNATIGALPFKDGIFSCVICSEVIEHTKENFIFEEMKRILCPGGTLILGTPDYGRLSWRIIEFFYGLFQPGGYKDKHIAKYTYLSLTDILASYGFSISEKKYICGSEVIIKARKDG